MESSHASNNSGPSQKINLWRAFLSNVDSETAEVYERAVRLFCDYMGYTLEVASERAGPNDIVNFASMLRNKGLASNSIRLYLSGVKKFYEVCDLPYSPTKLKLVVPKKRPEKENNEIPKSLAKEIILSAPPAKKLLFHFLWATGVRIGEALMIRKKDVSLGDVPKVVIKTEKTNRPRIVFLPSDLVARMKPKLERMGEDDYVFAVSYDPRRPLNRDKVGFAFRQTLRKNSLLVKDQSGRGYTYSLHSFRRSYESNLARAGVHPMIIKFLLGHSQGVEDHYLRLDEKTLFNEWKKAEPILRLDIEEKEIEDRVAELEKEVKILNEQINMMAAIIDALAAPTAEKFEGKSIPELGMELRRRAAEIKDTMDKGLYPRPEDLANFTVMVGVLAEKIKKLKPKK